jgi:hypothetical protein
MHQSDPVRIRQHVHRAAKLRLTVALACPSVRQRALAAHISNTFLTIFTACF